MKSQLISDRNISSMEPGEPLPEWLKLVFAQVSSLKFGIVQVTVHDSNVVQIERVEKTRFDLAR